MQNSSLFNFFGLVLMHNFLQVEVASFKNTRHGNIVLFLGYTFDQHKLGIVMNYCKGRPLHQLLHDHHEKFNFSEVVHFATQICQVSYQLLEVKQIVSNIDNLRFMTITCLTDWVFWIQKIVKIKIYDSKFFTVLKTLFPGGILFAYKKNHSQRLAN